MSDLSRIILEDIRSYENTPDVGVEIAKGKGLFNRRKVIRVFGAVRSEAVKEKVSEIVEKHAGDRYDVENQVRVSHPTTSS
jgi:hypothetical protein